VALAGRHDHCASSHAAQCHLLLSPQEEHDLTQTDRVNMLNNQSQSGRLRDMTSGRSNWMLKTQHTQGWINHCAGCTMGGGPCPPGLKCNDD